MLPASDITLQIGRFSRPPTPTPHTRDLIFRGVPLTSTTAGKFSGKTLNHDSKIPQKFFHKTISEGVFICLTWTIVCGGSLNGFVRQFGALWFHARQQQFPVVLTHADCPPIHDPADTMAAMCQLETFQSPRPAQLTICGDDRGSVFDGGS